MATAKELGLGNQMYVGNIRLAKSSFDVTGASDLDVGWAGIGPVSYTHLNNETALGKKCVLYTHFSHVKEIFDSLFLCEKTNLCLLYTSIA